MNDIFKKNLKNCRNSTAMGMGQSNSSETSDRAVESMERTFRQQKGYTTMVSSKRSRALQFFCRVVNIFLFLDSVMVLILSGGEGP